MHGTTIMPSRSNQNHRRTRTIPPLAKLDATSFDLACGIPIVTGSFIKMVEEQHLRYDPTSSVRVIIDIEAGFALHELENADRANIRIIVVTFSCCPEYWEDLWDLQPEVLIVDSNYEHDFASAIVRVTHGEKYRQVPSLTTPLSKHEREVLCYLARGWSNKRIALHTHVQEKTIMNTLTSVYNKLHLENRTQALLYYWGISTNVYAS